MVYQLNTDGTASLIIPPKRKAAKRKVAPKADIAEVRDAAAALGFDVRRKQLTGKLEKCWIKWGKQARTRR